MVKRFFDKWRNHIAFVLIIAVSLFGYVLIQHNADVASDKILKSTQAAAVAIRQSSIAGCERTNERSRAANDQQLLQLGHNRTTERVFNKIATEYPQSDLAPLLSQAVRAYQGFQQSYKPLDIIDCEKAYPDPNDG